MIMVTKTQTLTRLRSAAKSRDQLQSDVEWIVTNKAWEVVGHPNFTALWESELGFTCPTLVKILAIQVFKGKTRVGSGALRPGMVSAADIAKQLGLSHVLNSRTGRPQSESVSAVLAQLHAEISPEDITLNKRRATSRRMGKLPSDLVLESVYVIKSDVDRVDRIARESDVPKSEIYRQAIAEYLARHDASRPQRKAS
jgi:Ribbon-helix-helix protein, copG family